MLGLTVSDKIRNETNCRETGVGDLIKSIDKTVLKFTWECERKRKNEKENKRESL